MAEFQDLSIRDVVKEINESYFIPAIQREYVWLRNPLERKIEQLFDSLLRGYPISSFLIWKLKKTDIETDDKFNIQLYKFIERYDERKIHNEKINIEQVNSNDLYIVLDGQQRLTSLYIGLKGSRTLRKKRSRSNIATNFEEKKLFLNLKYIPNSEDPDDNYDFRFLTENEASSTDETKHWFKVGKIIDMSTNDIRRYSTEFTLTDAETDIIGNLHEAICNKSKISYFTVTDKSLEKALKIFIRVNSGGTQLSYSDLLMSILTATFSSDIRDMMNNLIDQLKEDGFGIMGRDQILKTCLLLTNCPHAFILRNFKKENIIKIEENWEEIRNSVTKAVKLLSEFGYKGQLSSAYIITAIAYFYFLYKEISNVDKVEVLKFIRMAQIMSYFSTTLDKKLDIIGDLIKNNKTFLNINNEISSKKIESLYINEDDIDRFMDLRYGDPVTFSVLQILYPNLDYKYSNFHIDHIFPKSKFNSRNKLLNSEFIGRENELFNLQLLEGEANIAKRAKDPEVWIKEEYKTLDAISAYKNRNFIKEELSLAWENIKEFEDNRSQKLLYELKKRLLHENGI